MVVGNAPGSEKVHEHPDRGTFKLPLQAARRQQVCKSVVRRSAAAQRRFRELMSGKLVEISMGARGSVSTWAGLQRISSISAAGDPRSRRRKSVQAMSGLFSSRVL